MLITIFLLCFRELIDKNQRNFRFCEIVKYRGRKFTSPAVVSYSHTRSTCALTCAGLTQCVWFSYNTHFATCSISNIPAYQNVGSGTIEMDIRHYAFSVGKSYTLNFLIYVIIIFNYN